MNSFVEYLKSKLDLCGFKMVRTTGNKILIFKCFTKYTKCIYISIFEDSIEISIDKVFDSIVFSTGIERLIIPKKNFNNLDDSINYIQRNIAI